MSEEIEGKKGVLLKEGTSYGHDRVLIVLGPRPLFFSSFFSLHLSLFLSLSFSLGERVDCIIRIKLVGLATYPGKKKGKQFRGRILGPFECAE